MQRWCGHEDHNHNPISFDSACAEKSTTARRMSHVGVSARVIVSTCVSVSVSVINGSGRS